MFHDQPLCCVCGLGRLILPQRGAFWDCERKRVAVQKGMSIMVGEGHLVSCNPALQLRPGSVLPTCTPAKPELSPKATIDVNSSRLQSDPHHNLVNEQYLPLGTGAQTGFFFFGCTVRAFGMLVPRPRIEPTPPAVEAQSPNHWTTREFPQTGFLLKVTEQNPNPKPSLLSGKLPTPPPLPLRPQTQGINSCLIKTDLGHWDSFLKLHFPLSVTVALFPVRSSFHLSRN